MVLALVGFFVAVALALFFGVQSCVFHHSWLVTVVWIFLWNLVGGVLSMPARLVFGAGEMWLWWERPPRIPHTPWRWEPQPRRYSADQKHWSNIFAKLPRRCAVPHVGGTGAGRRRQDPAGVAADRVAGVYTVVVDVCVAGFPLHTKRRSKKRRGGRRRSVVERTRLEAVRLTYQDWPKSP